MPGEAWAPWSGHSAALGAGDHVAMETSSGPHHLAVTEARTPRGGHAGVEGPAAKARAGGRVGAHCPVACLGAPGHGVDTGRAKWRPGLAVRGAEWLEGVVGAAVSSTAARGWERRGALVVSLCRGAGLAQAAGAEAGVHIRLGGCPVALTAALAGGEAPHGSALSAEDGAAGREGTGRDEGTSQGPIPQGGLVAVGLDSGSSKALGLGVLSSGPCHCSPHH